MLSARQLDDWQRYYALEPWGEQRQDLRAAQMCVAALQPWTKKTLKIQDFVLKVTAGSRAPEEMDADRLKRKAMALNAMMGGKIAPPAKPAGG